MKEYDLNKTYYCTKNIDFNGKNFDAQNAVKDMKSIEIETVYIPKLDLFEITNESYWFYSEIVKSVFVDKYSYYDFISFIPTEYEFKIEKKKLLKDV